MTCACPAGFRCYSDEPPFAIPEDLWPTICRSGGYMDAPPFRVNEQGRPSPSGIPVPAKSTAPDPSLGGRLPLDVTPSEDDAKVSTTTAPAPVRRELPPASVRSERLFAVPDPVPVRKTIDALSPSSAMTALQCPRKFEENKVLGREDPPSKPATAGTFVHKVMEWTTAYPVSERTVERAKPFAGLLWREATKAEGDPVELPDVATSDDERDVRGLRREVALHARQPGWDPRAFKEKVWSAVLFGVEIEPDYGGTVLYRELWLRDVAVAGVPMRGKADRIDEHGDGLAIMDYKSGAAKMDKQGRPDQRRLDEKSRQLHWYWDMVEAVLAARGDDRKVISAALVFLGKGGQFAMWVDPASRGRSRAELAKVWSDIGRWELAALQNGTRYPAETGPLCWWCPYFEGCGEGAAYMTGEGFRTVANRELYGDELPPARVEYLGWDEDRRERWHSLADANR